jgi:hypothetical protein
MAACPRALAAHTHLVAMRRSAEATTARRLAGVLWVTQGVLSFISYFVHDASWFFYAFLVPALVAWALAATLFLYFRSFGHWPRLRRR